MRLNTADKRAAYRAAMIRPNYTADSRNSSAGEVYAGELAGKLYAMAFRGSAGKPEWHYTFRNEEQRASKIAEFFESVAYSQERKAKARADKAAFVHNVKVGDIFRASWGYDQTNIDYYEVTALIGQHMAEVREIGCQSESTGWMTGNSVPLPGSYSTEADYSAEGEAYKAAHGSYPRKEKAARRVKIQGSGSSGPCFRVASYCCAYRMEPVAVVAGKPMFASSGWTAYA